MDRSRVLMPQGDLPMETINLYRLRTKLLKPDRFLEIGKKLKMKGEVIRSEEALFLEDRERALAFAQPGARFAGLMFYTDGSRGLGEIPGKTLAKRTAQNWAGQFLKEFDLLPKPRSGKEKKGGAKLEFEQLATGASAVLYDGRERRKKSATTEITSRYALDGIPLVGPRAKARFVFKDGGLPLMMHISAWEELEFYAEAERVREHELVMKVREDLNETRDCSARYNIVDVRLAYFAEEYKGGPDLLAPSYFVEVEYTNEPAHVKEQTQGIRRMIQYPAYR